MKDHEGVDDVGNIFRGRFKEIFILASIVMAAWVLNHIFLENTKEYFGYRIRFVMLTCVAFPAMCLLLGSLILLWKDRFVHSGSVCSGDFIISEDYDVDKNIENGYLVQTGLVIKFTTYILVVIPIISVLILICMHRVLFDYEFFRDNIYRRSCASWVFIFLLFLFACWWWF